MSAAPSGLDSDPRRTANGRRQNRLLRHEQPARARLGGQSRGPGTSRVSPSRAKNRPANSDRFRPGPGAPADIKDCCRTALRLKSLLDKAKLKSFPKTSGSKGLQVYVPLNRAVTYEKTKAFAHGIATELEKAFPESVVSNMQKSLRKGKVFVDWSQNDDHKTTVCVYSMRAKERPTVSTPITWDEVEAALKKTNGTALAFGPEDVLKRVEKNGDLFAPVLKLKQSVP